MTRPAPDPRIDDLATRVLHGLADEAERAELALLLAHSQENRLRFLEHTSLYGMLTCEAKAGSLAKHPDVFFKKLEKPTTGKTIPLLRFLLPVAAAVIAACVAVVIFRPTNAIAALDRVIVAMNEPQDREYRIEVVVDGPDSVSSRADRGRYPPSNHLHQAVLWLRGPGEFVLSQKLPNGQTRLIGGDGNQSWSMRGSGPVRVSPDPKRFGRAIFEPNGEFAFLDLRTQLGQLKENYRLEWLDHDSPDVLKLRGLKHSQNKGGPGEIEIWFHRDTGVIERMLLRQLPRGNRGPRSIAIILQSAKPLAPDFFHHSSHHEPGRTVTPES